VFNERGTEGRRERRLPDTAAANVRLHDALSR
jgi:hypothetical protein